MNLFETASRLKLRFDSPQGLLDVETLWDLPLSTTRSERASLDDIAKSLNKQIRESNEESFVTTSSATNTQLNTKFELVKYVISVKLSENETARKEIEKSAEKAKIMEIISKKQDQALESASLEDLQARLDSL